MAKNEDARPADVAVVITAATKAGGKWVKPGDRITVSAEEAAALIKAKAAEKAK